MAVHQHTLRVSQPLVEIGAEASREMMQKGIQREWTVMSVAAQMRRPEMVH